MIAICDRVQVKMATTVSIYKGYACKVCTESINVEIFAIILEV